MASKMAEKKRKFCGITAGTFRSWEKKVRLSIEYSISTKCLTKEVLESIKEPLTKKAKTAESCVEMSNEGGNYDYSMMTLVATISVAMISMATT